MGGCQQGSFRDLTPFLTLPDIPPQSGRSHSVPRTRPSILPDFRKFDFAHWKKKHTKTNKHILRDVISTPRQQTNNKQTTNTHEATKKGKTRSKGQARKRENANTQGQATPKERIIGLANLFKTGESVQTCAPNIIQHSHYINNLTP